MLAGVQFDLHCGIGDSGCGIRRAVSSPCRIPNSESRIPALLPQLCPQSLELALERAVDDHVAGVDDRAADQRGVDRRFDLDFAAEALAQRGLAGVEFAGGPIRRRSHPRLAPPPGLGTRKSGLWEKGVEER